MNLSNSFPTMSAVVLLACCNVCVGFSAKWLGHEVGTDSGSDGDPSTGPENMVCGMLLLIAIVFTIATLPSTEDKSIDAAAVETNDMISPAIEKPNVPDLVGSIVSPRVVRSNEVKEKWTTRERQSPINQIESEPEPTTKHIDSENEEVLTTEDDSKVPGDNQDLLLAAIHQLTTFHGDDCNDILLCADEPVWDTSMDETVCDIISCTTESIQNYASDSTTKNSDAEETVRSGDKEMEEISVNEVSVKEVSVVKERRTDLMSPFKMTKTVWNGMPTLRPINSIVSISSNSFMSTSTMSLGSDSIASTQRKSKVSPQPNEEWPILE